VSQRQLRYTHDIRPKAEPTAVEPHDVNVPAFKVVHHRRALSMDKFIGLNSEGGMITIFRLLLM
jgi:hypothetical protein